MAEGVNRKGRNGWTRGLFAIQMRFNLEKGFPAVTTKQLAFSLVKSELLWFLEGGKNGRLNDNRLKEIAGKEKTIWTDNAEAPYWKPKAKFSGDLGRIYGAQWRSWQKPKGGAVDQIADLIKKLRADPYDRRLVVTAWNPGELDEMALPPCHMIFQFFAAKGKLSLHMTQRSCDMFLGVPFNIASYALLLSMVAQVVGMKPNECVLTLNDAHIYRAHFKAVKEQLSRKPLRLPKLWLNPNIKELAQFTMEDIKLENYQHHPPIKAKMIV
ncbi:MAG: Thymidylate synthase [Parcubacteria group bacterium GW2011_GWB1_44_7]|nr:MAG: Thymidylate synthase [Parcubacteria group bacterium GW2011_GWB1_44_7]